MEVHQRLKNGRIRLVCYILPSFYGLKQAGKLWNKKIVKFFLEIGFIAINRDLCILFLRNLINNIIIMVEIYMNNIVIISNYDKIKNKINIQFSQIKDSKKTKNII